MQVFRGVHWSDDVLNHENIGFWHYLQPAYNVMGFISCAGTNFLLRSAPFASAGTYTKRTNTCQQIDFEICSLLLSPPPPPPLLHSPPPPPPPTPPPTQKSPTFCLYCFLELLLFVCIFHGHCIVPCHYSRHTTCLLHKEETHAVNADTPMLLGSYMLGAEQSESACHTILKTQ